MVTVAVDFDGTLFDTDDSGAPLVVMLQGSLIRCTQAGFVGRG